MNIDWSKAPKGATHCDSEGREFYRPASNYRGGEYYDPESQTWEILVDDFDQLIVDCKKRPDRPVWNGEGLPPVGISCEYDTSLSGRNPSYQECKIEAYAKGQVVFSCPDTGDRLYINIPDDCRFRPIRTPEQIAAEEREATVQKMIQDIGVSDTDGWDHLRCAALYDAGYRKQVAP